ncbi:MAG: hypothetical protein JNL83_06675 [Myxococcales bacterium]|nr:hypothetical protein [Myxococcales bacterium]
MRAVRSFLLTLRDRPALIAWAMFVASLPFYVGRSGLPQPGNALMFLALPLALVGWDRRLDTGVVRVFRAMVWFSLWVLIVNWGWSAVTGKFSFADYAIVPVYYVWNGLVVLCAFVLHRRYGDLFLRATLYAVLFDVVFQVIASFVYRTDLYRSELFFNNPNQLGYWSLLAACTIALLQKRLQLGLVKASAALVGCAYLGVMSASRAAVAGIAILLILLVFTNPRVIIAGIVAAILLVGVGGPLNEAINKSSLRAMKRESDTTFAQERGYYRIWQFKEYILVGAGEGDLLRFVDDPKRANEIHSSLGTVVFSYGIVGTILFVMLFVHLLRGAQPRMIVLLVPVLAYTVAHQGLRFTLFWVLLALFACLKVRGPPK